VRLARIAPQSEIARAPVAASASVVFADAGTVELAVEGPFFTMRLSGLGFTLLDAAERSIDLRRVALPSSTGGFSRFRTSLYRAEIPRPGAYEVRIAGLDPARDHSDCSVVFVQPLAGSTFPSVLALLASVGLTGACVALAAALLVGPSAGPTASRAPAPVARASTVRLPADAADGRRLASDPRRLADAREIVWPLVQLRVRVPRDWIVRTQTATELDLRHPTTPSTFVLAHVTPIPAGPTFDQYVEAHLAHAREQLAQRRIDGYATKRIGVVPGLLTLEHRDGGGAATITWTGFQPAVVGSLSVTLLAGATADDFARDETLLGAIVDSVRFD
jgi:hypothetical protein